MVDPLVPTLMAYAGLGLMALVLGSKLAVASGIIVVEGNGRKVTVGSPTSIAVIGSMGALGAVAYVAITSGAVGGAGQAAPPTASYDPPATPTHDAVVFAPTGDSLRIIGSTFSGDADDTQDSMAIQVDTAGGDFTSPQYFNDTIGAVTTDTIPALDSAAVVVSRIAYKGANGGWSAWSDSLTTTMEQFTILFQCDWDGTAPRNDTENCNSATTYAGYPDDWTLESDAAHDTGMVVVDASDEGLPAGWPNDRAVRIMCSDRNDPGGCGAKTLRLNAEWALPDSGEVWAYRVTWTESSDFTGLVNLVAADDHGYGPTTGGNGTVYIGKPLIRPDSFRFQMDPLSTVGGFPDNAWCVTLSNSADCNTNNGPGGGLKYWAGGEAFEWHLKVEFFSGRRYTIDLRVYDLSGTLLYDADDFVNNQNDTLSVRIADGTKFETTSGGPWEWDYLRIGSSAFPGSEVPGNNLEFPMRYIGGFAICVNNPDNDGFCPTYGGLPGES